MKQRKDTKGRLLKAGESQSSDGRYRYRYTDKNGKRHTVYAWRLTLSDKTPKGKRTDKCLREKEEDVAVKLAQGLDAVKENLTINDCFDMVMRSKVNLKESSKNIMIHTFDKNIRNGIGKAKVANCTQSDIIEFYANLFEDGKKRNTVKSIHSLLHMSFDKAVDCDVITKNITTKALKAVSAGGKDEVSKKPPHALTKAETAVLLNYLRESNSRWSPLVNFLLHTGCRIGEVIGLTWDDIDFENNEISINHGVYYTNGSFVIGTPKTKNSIRIVPLFPNAKQALIDERQRQKEHRIHSKMTLKDDNGKKYHNFIFLNDNGRIRKSNDVNTALKHIIVKANDYEKFRAEQENRSPIELKPFSCHDLRHTFCTRLCESETNIKVAMSITGHSEIKILMNIYNELQEEQKKTAFQSIGAKFCVV